MTIPRQKQILILLVFRYLTDNNISKVKTIEFTLDVRPNDDYMKEYKTGVAKLTLK